MKYKYLPYFLSFLLIVATSILYIQKNQYDDLRLSIIEQSSVYVKKNEYLKDCIKYQKKVDVENLNLNNKNIVVYYTGETCSICVESLLLFLEKEYNLNHKVLVVVDTNNKESIIQGINDSFQLNFDFILKPNINMQSQEDILVAKLFKGKVEYVLMYKPEEYLIFKEYFDFYNYSL